MSNRSRGIAMRTDKIKEAMNSKMLILLLSFILFAGATLCQNAPKETGPNSGTPSHNSDLIGSATVNSSLPGQSPAEKEEDIRGIWSINLNGSEQYVMVLHQIGDDLFGSCKSDATGWNAAVLGSMYKTRLDLVTTANENGSLTSIRFNGTLQNQSISGTFVRSDDLGNFDSGSFKAVLINRDISGYSPAKSAKTARQSVSAPDSSSSPSPPPSDSSATSGQSQPKQLGDSKYVDVHSMSGYVPESLGVGFVGDGTMGAGMG